MSMLIITHPTKPGDGEVRILGGEGRANFESAVQTCAHCQAVVELHRKDSPYGFCRKCNAVLCAMCGKKAAVEGCSPFMAAIERYQEEQYRLSRSYPLAG